jgi:RNA polymerase sigma-70 factor, ECF subfamily
MTDGLALVAAARARDRDAFARLVGLETPEAWRLTYSILRSTVDAEDALQDAFVTAWTRLPNLREPGSWPGWFRRIVVSAAIDQYRRRRRRTLASFIRRIEPVPDASREIEVRDALDEQLASLEPIDRALLTLRYGLDLEMTAVAAALGMPVGTAKSRVHRALQRLRRGRTHGALPET